MTQYKNVRYYEFRAFLYVQDKIEFKYDPSRSHSPSIGFLRVDDSLMPCVVV